MDYSIISRFKVALLISVAFLAFAAAPVWGAIPDDVSLDPSTGATAHSLTLSWSPSADTTFKEYRLYRSLAALVDTTNDLVATIATQSTTTFKDTLLQVATTYYYKIFVVNTDDTLSTGSNEVSGTTLPNAYPFFDDAEGSTELNWSAASPWGLSQATPYSGNNSWTDSPVGNYANSVDASLTLRIDLSTAQMPVLTFWTRYGTQTNADYARLEVSLDGSNWTVAGYWSGSQSTWKQIRIDLTPWVGSSDVRIRWRFTSDGSTVSDGWYIDEVSIDETPTPNLGYPFVESFDDTTGVDKWHASQWEITTDGHSVPGRIHDSPTGNYLQSGGSGTSDNPNSFTSLTTAGVIDLSGAVEPVLTFWQKYDLRSVSQGWPNYINEHDYGRVYISTNYGLPGTWTQIYSVTGSKTDSWEWVEVDLSAYVGSPTVRLRFIVDDQRDQDTNGGDQSGAGNGWWIDDIRVEDRPGQVTLNTPTDISMHGATLSWSANADADFARYEIYRDTSSRVDRSSLLLATITDQATTTYRDDYQIVRPHTYYYRIYVIDSLETVSHGSNVVSADYTVPIVTFPLTDNVEVAADTANWAWSYPWGRTTAKAHSGLSGWTDSPGASYAPNANTALTTNVNLSGSTTPVLTFWHQYSFETNADYGLVEVSTDGGTSWTTIHSVTGIDTAWNEERIDLSTYVGNTIGLRFRVTSNGSTHLDGWYLDDIQINDGVRVVGFPFREDFEDGFNRWFVGNPWGLTTDNPHDGTYAMTESPSGAYTDSANTSLLLHIDLSSVQMPVLTFWTRYGTQTNADYARLEVSLDGSNWTVAGYWSGSQSTWKQIRIDLTPWVGSSDVRIRWRFTSDGSTVSDGWYIDEVSIDETPMASLGYPFLDSFDDTTGVDRWHTSQWEITTDGHSVPGRMHDSPTGNYLQSGGSGTSDNPNSFTSLTTAGVIDLSGAIEPVLTFWQKYDLRSVSQGWPNYINEHDYGRVYISTNYGLPGTWTQIYSVTGSKTDSWERVEVDLSAYVGSPTVRLRFVVDDQRDQDTNGGDQSGAGNGWWIDDIRVEDRPGQVTLNTPTDISMHGTSLSWSANADADFARYEIYRDTSSRVDRSSLLLATITDQATTTYRDDYQIVRPHTYYYRIYVVDSLETPSIGSNVVNAAYTVPTVSFPFVDTVSTASDTLWEWSAPWGRTTIAHSDSFSWTDSPGASYAPNTNTALTTNVNLSGSGTPVLQFWHRYAFESGVDFGLVEVSTDGGATWATIHSVTGVHSDWNEERIDLSAYTGSTIGLRFRVLANDTNQLDGWYIDDIHIEDGVQIIGYPFFDDMESGISNWFIDSPWGLSRVNPYSGLYSWTDSPASSYDNNANNALTLRIDLSTAQMPVLTFWTRYGTQTNADYARLEVSLDGSNWTVAGYWSGSQSTWRQIRIDLTPWVGSSDVRIRWRFTSDGSTVSDGWYIDDVSIDETPTPNLGYPFLESFDDTTGVDRWHTSQWEITTDGHSVPGRIHDSPTGNYLQSGGSGTSDNPNSFTSLTTAGVIDLSGAIEPVLTFWQKYDLRSVSQGWPNYINEHDYGRVYISTNYGLPGTWTQIYSVTGSKTDSWERVEVDLSAYVGSPTVRLRFVVDDQRDQDTNGGDQSGAGNGWWIDDMAVHDNLSGLALVDTAYLEKPASTASTPGQPTERIYGLVYEPGVTDSTGMGSGIQAQLGYGQEGSYPNDTTWTWVNATYLDDQGVFDRYYATLTAGALGIYNYAYRFKLETGPWLYADLNGNDQGAGGVNGYQTEQAGTLAVSNRPDMQMNVDSIAVILPVDAIQNWSFRIGNGGMASQGALNFNLHESADGSNPVDMAWLAVNPARGTVPVGGRLIVTVTLDGTGLKADTTYHAYLLVNSNDPNRSQVSIPVRLDVVAADAVMLNGVITDVVGGRIPTFARLEVLAGDSVAANVTTDANSNYSVFGLSAGTYDLRVTAQGYYRKTIAGVAIPDAAFNITLHRIPPITPTNTSVNVYGSNSMFNGQPLRPGQVITAVDPDGIVCGVFTVHTSGEYGFLHVYGDDPTTPDRDEGASSGDTLRFFINEFPAQTTGPDAPVWTANNAVINVNLNATKADRIPLNNNWNLISFTTIPASDSVTAVLNSIEGHYRLVSTFDISLGGARTYDPILPQFSDLWTMDPRRGYWIKMLQADTLTLAGERFNSDQLLSLEQGWNLTAYLPENQMKVAEALQTIEGNYTLVSGFDNGAMTYVPGSSFNDLNTLVNGLGYWIKMNQPGLLNYAGLLPTPAARPLPGLATTVDKAYPFPVNVTPTPWWTDYYGTFTVAGEAVPVGDVIEAYDPDGVKCGEFTVRQAGSFGFLHVYGDDPNTPKVDEGAQAGDLILFYYNGTLVATAENAALQWTGDRTPRKLNINATSPEVIESDNVPETYALSQNYPNPFNPATQIRYQLPQGGIVILKVYDLLGREVRTLVNEEQNTGYYNVLWDGKSDQGREVASGIYFYRIQAGDFSETRKMLLLR